MDVTIDLVNKTNRALIENIKRELLRRNWKVPRLAKACGLSASGLYGVLDGTRWPGPDNLDRIAKALGTTSGKLLEQPSPVEQQAEPEKTREELFAALVEKAIHLDKDGLAVAIESINSPPNGELAKANARIRELEEKLAAIEEADQLIEDTEEMLGDRETKPKTRKKSD